ncbi:glycine-rich domain-containing protein [Sphaerisporangium aureirubrum]|uniref:Glycine-rich domain-containing protein n=1 Tax=Sphaerisporangium aureirubrum TaxID=1544736 RepID=A0ABW1NC99_9ACTN
MTTMTSTKTVTDVRALVPADLFTRLVNRIVTEELVTAEYAERVMTQALAFLQACALNPGAALAPSKQVDVGWHTFILYTRDYAAFCDTVAGRFIHHRPTDDQDGASTGHTSTIGATVDAMTKAGLPVDADLWSKAADCDGKCKPDPCSQCHQGCTDSN